MSSARRSHRSSQVLRRGRGRSAGSASRSPPARSSACSARTEQARRRRSRSSRATASATRAPSSVLGAGPGPGRQARGGERIGVVLQSSAMYETLSVAESLAPLRRVLRAAARRGRGGRAGRARRRSATPACARSREVSGGGSTSGSRSSATRSSLFLDEPTTGFDPQARRRAWESISSLRTLGKTILLTTHYLDEAEHLCDRVGVLRGGRFAAHRPARRAHRALPPSEVRFRRRRPGGRAPHRGADARAPRADGEGARRGTRARRAPGSARRASRRSISR